MRRFEWSEVVFTVFDVVTWFLFWLFWNPKNELYCGRSMCFGFCQGGLEMPTPTASGLKTDTLRHVPTGLTSKFDKTGKAERDRAGAR